MKSSKKLNFLLFTLVFIGVGLRLWRLPELFHFTYDEEIIAFVGKRMFINGHIPLIGGVTPMHVHLAPYFYWLSGILLFFSKLNPIGWGVMAAFLAGMTMLFLYHTGQKIFGSRVGFIAVFIYAFSFYQNIFDRHYWGLAFDGILSLIVLLSLYELRLNNHRFAYLLAGALAFGFHTDPSTLVLFILAVLAWVVFKIRLPAHVLVKASLIFFLSFLPLIVFDFKHDFSNSRGFIQYIEEVKEKKIKTVQQSSTEVILFPAQALARLLLPVGDNDLAYQYSYCPNHVLKRVRDIPAYVGFLLLIFLTWRTVTALRNRRKQELPAEALVLMLIVSTYMGIFLYGIVFKSNLFDHYLATLFPPFLLLAANGINQIFERWKYVALVVLILFSIFNLHVLFSTYHRFGFSDKEEAVKWAIATTGNEPFSLDVIGDCFRYNGYRYLFYLLGKEPVKSYVDANFTHLYDQPPAQTHPKQLIVITNPDIREPDSYYQEYNDYRKHLIVSRQFGQIEVLLIDNSKLDFINKF